MVHLGRVQASYKTNNMIKKVVIKNGKKYIVNAPSYGDVGGTDYGVGSGGPIGTLWMKSITDNNWYAVNVSGPAASSAISVNQTALTYQSNGSGNELMLCDDGASYIAYLTGVPNAVTFTVTQTPFSGSASPKPDLLLQSVTNGNFYMVTLKNTAGTIAPLVNQSAISASRIVY